MKCTWLFLQKVDLSIQITVWRNFYCLYRGFLVITLHATAVILDSTASCTSRSALALLFIVNEKKVLTASWNNITLHKWSYNSIRLDRPAWISNLLKLASFIHRRPSYNKVQLYTLPFTLFLKSNDGFHLHWDISTDQ